MQHYLVTGGAGFIGSHLAVRLLRDRHRVRVLDDLSTGRRENLEAIAAAGAQDRFEWIEGDVRSSTTCLRACKGIDFVLHQAALASVPRSVEDPVGTTQVNVMGTLTVLEAARRCGVRRVVLASSSSVYGDTEVLPKSEDMEPRPLSPYACAKLAGETFARVFAVTLGLPTISLRYFNVFGPRQNPDSAYAAVVPRFARALLERRRPQVFGDGHQSRDFTFVDNVVQANLDACTRGEGRGEAINIACGERYSLMNLLDELASLTGQTPDPEMLPPRPGDVRHSQASIDRARRLLGFSVQTGFREGLERTVQYYRDAG